MKDLYHGSEIDLERVVKTHLFVICPNKSGSTFLKNVLATSKRTWNLDHEGQHTFGFAGPSSRGLKTYNRWASERRWIEELSNADNFDWDVTRRAWYFQAFSRSPEARVFVEKSPPFLLIVDQLAKTFQNARFLFMVRNPYAMIEGIRRHSPRAWLDSLSASKALGILAAHVVECLRFQRRNIERWSDRGVFFTYEQMCDQPETVEGLIRGLVPDLDDLVLRRRVRVRDYDEELRNMNGEQIARLGKDDLAHINKVYFRHEDIMSYFNYSFIE